MKSIEELAEDARGAVEDLIDDDRWGWFVSLAAAEQVQWRYCHADCDDFAWALSEITGWPVVGITNPSHGPLHRLVEAPDGRLLDARGWVTLDDLRQRYGVKRLKVVPDWPYEALLDGDEDYRPIVEALLQLPGSPFDEPAFQAQVRAFADSRGLLTARPNRVCLKS